MTYKTMLIVIIAVMCVLLFILPRELHWVLALFAVAYYVVYGKWWRSKPELDNEQRGQLRAVPADRMLKNALLLWKTQKGLCVFFPPALFTMAMLCYYAEKTESALPVEPTRYIVLGTIFAVTMFILLLPSWFVQQDEYPSDFQRLCRKITLFVCATIQMRGFASAVNQLQNTLFKYWLSHPNVEITNELIEQLADIDTFRFDWQFTDNWPLIEGTEQAAPSLPTDNVNRYPF